MDGRSKIARKSETSEIPPQPLTAGCFVFCAQPKWVNIHTRAEITASSEMAPLQTSSGSGVSNSSRSCSTGSRIHLQHVSAAHNAEPTPLDQSILASAISSGMPTFLLTKGVSNDFLEVERIDSRSKGSLYNVKYCRLYVGMYRHVVHRIGFTTRLSSLLGRIAHVYSG